MEHLRHKQNEWGQTLGHLQLKADSKSLVTRPHAAIYLPATLLRLLVDRQWTRNKYCAEVNKFPQVKKLLM